MIITPYRLYSDCNGGLLYLLVQGTSTVQYVVCRTLNLNLEDLFLILCTEQCLYNTVTEVKVKNVL